MSAPTVGLALIVRDEAKTLPTLLESIEGAFDQVCLLDTGSKDKTLDVFRDWVAAERERYPDFEAGFNLFEWVDDFGAARARADEMLDTDWLSWADADDVIRNAGALREVATNAPPQIGGFIAGYDYAQDEHGNCICHLKRERLVRRGMGTWGGRVHEAQTLAGQLAELPRETVEWVHRKGPGGPDSNKRNLRILRAWVKDEPENPRVLGYLGTEELARGKPKRAIPMFRRYLKLRTGWDEERAQIHRKLAMALASQSDYRKAIATAFEALELLPAWPDSALSLAECYHQLGEWTKAEHWARVVLTRGVPDTLLIVNPLDYVVAPRLILSSSLGGQNRVDEAIEVAEEALQIVPDHGPLLEAYQGWRGQRKRESTAQTFLAAAQQLVSHDEQLKALRLLEDTVPYYATDHPEIVGARSVLRERLASLLSPAEYVEHYTTGGSKPEDFIDDERVDELGAALPRCGFLLEGVLEQAGVSA